MPARAQGDDRRREYPNGYAAGTVRYGGTSSRRTGFNLT